MINVAVIKGRQVNFWSICGKKNSSLAALASCDRINFPIKAENIASFHMMHDGAVCEVFQKILIIDFSAGIYHGVGKGTFSSHDTSNNSTRLSIIQYCKLENKNEWKNKLKCVH